jgi:hypothetical protein
VLVIVLGFAAWVAPFALAKTSCWVARAGPDGTLIYTPIPVPDDAVFGSGGGHVELDLAPTDIGTGCDTGAVTIQGAAVAAAFGIGVLTVTMLASTQTSLGPGAPREEYA